MFAHVLRRLPPVLVAFCIATLLAACGGDDGSPSQPSPPVVVAPTIAIFTATPATLPAGGGQVALAWTTSGATTLSIDNGVGDVSGTTGKTITVSRGTTFTLTATNTTGSVAATTSVTVAAVAPPTITAFIAAPSTLSAPGTVTLSWTTTGATTLTIDQGVGDVSAATSKAVTVAASTTYTLTATNAAGAVSRTTSVAIAQAADRYVDSVAGSDSNPCTQAAPCRSIRVSLLGAQPGATLALADGIYSQATEGGFDAPVPDGVTLRATHPGAATLADIGVRLMGSATLNGLVVGTGGAPDAAACGSIQAGIGTTTVTVNVIGVFSNCPHWLTLLANVHATMTPGALPGGVYTSGLPAGFNNWISVSDHAQLLIQGGVLDGHGTGMPIEQNAVLDVGTGATLTLDGVTMRNYAGIGIHTVGTAVLKNDTLIDHVGVAGDPGPLTFSSSRCAVFSAIVIGATNSVGGSFSMDHSTLSNAPSAGICVAAHPDDHMPHSLQITQSTITQIAGAAIESGIFFGTSATFRPPVTIDGSALTNNGRAILWVGGVGTAFNITNTTITGNTGAANTGGIVTDPCLGAAVRFDVQADPGSFKLRGSTISNNAAEGLCLMNATGALSADLGTSADPGGNTFTVDPTTGVRLINSVTTTVNAVGNTWTPGQQGADASGFYSVPPAFVPVPKTGPTSGVNFKIDTNRSTLNL